MKLKNTSFYRNDVIVAHIKPANRPLTIDFEELRKFVLLIHNRSFNVAQNYLHQTKKS